MQIKNKGITNQKTFQIIFQKIENGFPSVAICNDYNVIKRAKKGI